MPRYMVEHDFSSKPAPRGDTPGAGGQSTQVTWLRIYMSQDRKTSFCVYEAPSPEAIREMASLNNLPVRVITEVEVTAWNPR